MILYHFPTSPFARRVRIALGMKGLSAELRDARAEPAHREEANRLNPMHTVPVLVDGDRVITQSAAMLHYLDVLRPSPPLFPTGDRRVTTAGWVCDCDEIITIMVDLALRYAPLHGAPAFSTVEKELGQRAQRALDALVRQVGDSREWQVGEQAVYTTVAWIEGLPERAKIAPLAKRMLEIGVTVPPALSAWADQHRKRPEVLAL